MIEGIDGKSALVIVTGRPDCAVAVMTAWRSEDGRSKYADGPWVKLGLDEVAHLTGVLMGYLEAANWGGELFERRVAMEEWIRYLLGEAGLDDE